MDRRQPETRTTEPQRLALELAEECAPGLRMEHVGMGKLVSGKTLESLEARGLLERHQDELGAFWSPAPGWRRLVYLQRRT